MYESVLKTATDNPEFEFKVLSKPLPVVSNWISRGKTVKYNDITQIVNVVYALAFARIAMRVIRERYTKKHYYYMVGLDFKAYWFMMFIGDLGRLVVISLVINGVFNAYDMQYNYFLDILLMYSFAMVFYIYAIMSCFKKNSSALAAVLSLHFFMMYFGELIMGTARVMV
mmetsp:Transcript_25896/g.18342  ORF Transcript_25896/g.18342 Transcript_25896/m.18342 type:complete len:170 (-) Transcript_25896:1715-2224(-)